MHWVVLTTHALTFKQIHIHDCSENLKYIYTLFCFLNPPPPFHFYYRIYKITIILFLLNAHFLWKYYDCTCMIHLQLKINFSGVNKNFNCFLQCFINSHTHIYKFSNMILHNQSIIQI